MRNNPLSLCLFLVLVISIVLITSIVSAADPALHPNLSNTKNPVLSAAAINSPESPLSGQLLFSYENFTQAWTPQNASAGWRARLFPTRVAAPDSKKAFLSPGITQETHKGGNRTDSFAVIDEKLAPSEAAGLKSLIQDTLHAFSYDAATADWYARNAANRITFTYTQDGTAKFSEGENAFGLTLLGIGRGDGISPAGKGNVQADGRQLNIVRPDYTEWYKNNDEGVEQGMTIASRPTGSGLLHVGFELTGDNSLSLKDKKTLILTDASGKPLFEYTGLHAFSSDGRDLPASLATDGKTVSWVVDDTRAVYPVTIDPVVSASAADARFTGGAMNDYFGYFVALSSDGSTALVGAYYNDTPEWNTGAAYIFEKGGGWSSKTASAANAQLTGGLSGESFGYSVALSSDGSTALVGAISNETAGSDAGAAYIFVKPGGGWVSRSASAADASFTGGAMNDYFGYSVALSPDGSTALVGAYYNDTADSDAGAAYIFEKGGGWSSKSASAANAQFTGGLSDDNLGYSVALSGDTALVGAPYNRTAASGAGAAYIFEKGGGWSSKSASAANAQLTGGAANDNFGYAVALSSDGSTALAGAMGNDTAGSNAGAAYIFVKGGGWSSRTASAADARFTGGAATDRFGYSVALSSDGSTALVGAYHNSTAGVEAGAAYSFGKGGGWSSKSASAADSTFTGGAANDEFGYSVALSSEGSTALVGAIRNDTAASDAGAAYIFLTAAAPTITGISPTGGTTAGGTSVTITGTGFTGATAVKFGATNAASYTVNSATQITAVSPVGSAGTVDITVTTSAGTSATGAADRFTYSTPTPTPAPTNAGGDSDGPAAPVGPVAPVVPGISSTTEVNVGGNSAVTQVTITGTGISGAIVTGTVVSGPGLNTAPPTPMVYEYVDITPARYTTISDAMISFTVPVTWLTERQLTPPNVVMYHLVEKTWVALPTTLVKVENGVAYYTAASPGFSRFAITGQAGITSATTLAKLTPAGQTYGDMVPTTSVTKTPTPAAAVTAKPVTTQTTAIPAISQPAPALPLQTIAIVWGIIVVLVAGGFLTRRWLIRRQNPALFREL
jgi:PGF-pre-PGF domain-containing protein